MQVNRTHTAPNATLFPPAGGQGDAEKSAQALLSGGAGAAGAPGVAAPVRGAPVAEVKKEAPAPQGVVLKLSTPDASRPEHALYTKAGTQSASVAAAKIDLNNMTLENQLALGKDKGVFTKITLSKDGVLLAAPKEQPSPQAPEFVSSAVTAMRDFQEGIALLKEQGVDTGSKSAGFFSGGLRSLQSAAAKLNVFA